MRHVLAFLIKFLSTLVVLGIILGVVFGSSIADVFTISIVLSIIGYTLGDLFLLRRTSNVIATSADFGLSFIVIWLVSSAVTNEAYLYTSSLLAASMVTIFEFFYHRIVPRRDDKRQATNQNANQKINRSQFKTEASEDMAIARPDVRSSDENNKGNNK
jgi:hypothetical protein